MFIKKRTILPKQSQKILHKKKARHEPSGWAMFTRCSFDKKENKLNYYRGKDCIEKLCKKLKECAMKIINYEEKEMIPLTKEEKKFNKKQQACYISEENFCVYKVMKVVLIEKRLMIIVITQENLKELLIVNAT